VALSIVMIAIWLWTGTGEIPEKDSKPVGRGVTLPFYVSGPRSAGWWAMAITMLAIFTAFICLVFGYFFYWTLHAGFIPPGARVQTIWAFAGLAAAAGAWFLTLLAKRWNTQNRGAGFYGGLLVAVALSITAAAGILAHPYFAGLDPTTGVYAAVVWLLVIWSALHLAIGVLMQLYCIARRMAGRLTAKYDMDIVNVVLYWHFTIVTIAITIAITAGMPYLL